MNEQGSQQDEFAPALTAALVENLRPAPLLPERRAALRTRVLGRLFGAGERTHGDAGANTAHAEDEGDRDTRMRVLRDAEGQWLDALPGVRIKPLRIDRRQRTQTTLWQLQPGARIPAHGHDQDEECLIVAGKLEWDGAVYGSGDYLLTHCGLHHTEFSSSGGATLLIRGELTPYLERLFTLAGC